ncbi:HAD family phosphatase [Streptomyces sp. NPDC047097]|uniref:HAD family hydrolase n=1 Tax=Streptomyces sp. NPDC047097 TaxID=3155260 RepID=UPI0033FA6C88
MAGGGLTQLRAAAVNIDGVMLNDTFSPVIHHFIVSRGGVYTAELERRIFSQRQAEAARAIAEAAGLAWSTEKVLEEYFRERAAYLERHPVRILDGALALVGLLRSLGLRTVCYGGLERAHFDAALGEHAGLFDDPGYVCTDAYRPGLREIVTETFGLRPDQVLVIDDVARVAETARGLGAPFIGNPSDFAYGFQRAAMREAGVRHLVRSPAGIGEELVRTLDAEAAAGTCWTG